MDGNRPVVGLLQMADRTVGQGRSCMPCALGAVAAGAVCPPGGGGVAGLKRSATRREGQ